MRPTRLAPLVGILGCLLVVGLLAAPYVLVRTAPGTAVGTYYATGAINPLVAGFFAFVSVIIFAAGREDRTDPGLAAGITLALGVFVFALCAVWAVTVPLGVVVDMDAPVIIEHHRWATSIAAATIPVAGAWWARTLGLL